jgi:hypothetical protein
LRRIVITAVVMGLGAAVPAAAAAPTTDYSGTTAQGKSVALTLSKQGTAKSLKSFKIAWDAPCRGTSFVFHASARLTGVDVTGGRFAGHTRSEAPAGANRIAHLRLHLRGAFAKGGGKATGRWRGPVRIANRKGTTVLTCKSGLVRFTAERE